MSGGSYNYAYARIDELAEDVARNSPTPERKAFVKLLTKVALAAKAIEWNDSGDGDEREDSLIRDALGDSYEKVAMQCLIEESERLIKDMIQITSNHNLT